jgi:hypothetical protein
MKEHILKENTLLKPHEFTSFIEKRCKEEGIVPLEMLSHVFWQLNSSHVLQAIGGFRTGTADNKCTVINEIQGIMSRLGTVTIPASLLASIEALLRRDCELLTHNVNLPTPAPESMKRQLKVLTVFHEMIQELLNHGERFAIGEIMAHESIRRLQGGSGPASDEPKK